MDKLSEFELFRICRRHMKFLESGGLFDCDAEQAVFDGLDLRGMSFKNKRISFSVFINCMLEGVVFDGSSLSFAEFESCILDRASFKGCKMHHIKMTACSAVEIDTTGAMA